MDTGKIIEGIETRMFDPSYISALKTSYSNEVADGYFEIEEKEYAAPFLDKGYQKLIKYGICFCEKNLYGGKGRVKRKKWEDLFQEKRRFLFLQIPLY